METNASEVALALTLNQDGRQVAFFSTTLQGPEVRHPSVEKEAQAITESIRYLEALSHRKPFQPKDCRSPCLICLINSTKGRSRITRSCYGELSYYSFNIVYRPGKENVPPDSFSQSSCPALLSESLYQLYQSLCHPGITRMYHFSRVLNLPYSVEKIKKMTNACRICCKCKPSCHRTAKSHLIKAISLLRD